MLIGQKMLAIFLTQHHDKKLNDFDILVVLFRKTRWVWNLSKGKMLSNASVAKNVNELTTWELHQKLMSILLVETFNFQSKGQFLEAILDLAEYCNEAVCNLVIGSAKMCYWNGPKSFISFLEKYYRSVILTRPKFTQSRMEFITNVMELFMTEDVIREDLENLANKVVKIIAMQPSTEQLTALFDLVARVGVPVPDSVIECLIDTLFETIANIKFQNSDLKTFWSPFLSSKVNLENIPDPKLDSNCSPLGLDLQLRQFILFITLQLFDTLVYQRRMKMAMRVYKWLARFCGWISVVETAIRKPMIRFLGSFSCNEIGRLVYKSQTTSKIESTSWDFMDFSELSVRFEFDGEFLFSLTAILKFETNPEVLMFSLDQLQIVLQSPVLYTVNAIALKLLAQTICKIVMTESAGSKLENVPISFRKYEIYEQFFQILGELFVYNAQFDRLLLETFLNVLLFGVGKWPQAAKQCIRGLTLALFEMPNTCIRLLSGIIMKISQYTSNNLALVNLRFLAALASLPNLHKNLAFEDYKRIFGVALTYLRLNDGQSGQILALGYYVAQVWFLSLKLSERKKYVPIIATLLLANTSSSETKQPAESVELVKLVN